MSAAPNVVRTPGPTPSAAGGRPGPGCWPWRGWWRWASCWILRWGRCGFHWLAVVKILLGQAADSPAWAFIVREIRLPKALTALAVGSGLAVSGLQMQTLFRNPLAGPSALGLTAGASLGVAAVMLASGSGAAGGLAIRALGVGGSWGLVLAASARRGAGHGPGAGPGGAGARQRGAAHRGADDCQHHRGHRELMAVFQRPRADCRTTCSGRSARWGA
ncbi:MAG: iron chelate uptake ABC transporter family permease subunit [Hymenobacter sp.]